MELSREKAKKNLTELVEKFERELSAEKIKDYNEEATKIAFIQPLLKDVLGWDVNNRDEVSPEETISSGRVDYGLKVEGKIKVFVEAKPPKADLNKHVEQAIRYGYNRRGVPFVLLTDFEELKLFDVTVKPDMRNPLKGLKIDLRWDQYLKKFDDVWLLSKESVIQGKLDKLLLVKPKDRLPVDKAILDDLKRWREVLAKDIFKNNPHLFHAGDPSKDAEYLKEITQRILDRIMFMRSCEDRGLVHRHQLKELFEERSEAVGMNTMIFLREEFKHYNIIFDSDLFSPQDWEDKLSIDFKVLRNIVLETYNPYQFDVIPLEVLGNIYEQYLGYTIRLTDHQVKYELKPDVRKAGGVYYTPEYIVDYIVKNTVGKLLKELPYKKIKELRILDPACGSGSFLIRAYEEMLNYYRNLKKKEKKQDEKQKKLGLKHIETEPGLTIHEKAEILRNHIYGVDIDEQAVEVTKLSLMLKMLEGEYGLIGGRAILPMLDKNIRCGNSLISGDTLELKKYFGDDWLKVKPFNWNEEFRKIMVNEGGFDVVIGNPPYIRIQNLPCGQIDYLTRTYHSAKGNCDLYVSFVERGYNLLKPKGLLGKIVPNKFFKTDYGEGLRELLATNKTVTQIVDFGASQVFDATNYTCLLFLTKQSNRKFLYTKTHAGPEALLNLKFTVKNSESLTEKSWVLASDESATLWKKISRNTQRLLDLPAYMSRGSSTGDDEVFLLGNINLHIESAILREPIFANDFSRYCFSPSKKWRIIFPYIFDKGSFRLYTEEELKKKFPRTYAYLKSHQITLKRRKQYKEWFGYSAPRNLELHDRAQIIVPLLADRGLFALIPKNTRGNLCPMASAGFTITLSPDCLLKPEYLLGILNSRLLFWKLQQMSNIFRGGWITCTKQYFGELPIRIIDFSDLTDKQLHDELVALVDIMLDLNKKIQNAKGGEKEQLQRQIDKTDGEIDDLVYKLYGITDEERKIIEEEVT